MQLPNLSLSYLLLELKSLEGSFVQKVQLLDNSTLRLQLRSKETGRMDWIIAPQATWISRLKVSAQPSTGFAAFLDKKLEGQKLEKLEQHGQDRVLVAHFSKHDLMVELFAEGNLILCEKGTILQPFHRQEWKDRKLWRGEVYKFPPEKKSLLDENAKGFSEKAIDSKEGLVSFLVSAYGVAPLVGEEIALCSGISKGVPANKLSAEEISSVLCSARDVLEVNAEKFSPQKAEFKKETWLLPFSFRTLACTPIASFSEELDSLLSAPALPTESRKQKGLQNSILQQEKAKLRFVQEADEFQRAGEWLKASAGEVQSLIDFVREEKAKGKSWKDVEVALAKRAKKDSVLGAFKAQKLEGPILVLRSDE